jgi:hypothetical protein
MTKTIENLFSYLSAGSDFLIVLLFFLYFKKVRIKRTLWTIFFYCFASLILNYIGEQVPIKFEFIFYTAFTLVEYLIFSFFLWVCIANSFFKKAILYTSIIFIAFVISYLIIVKHQKIDSIAIGIETILILVYSFYYLYEQMNKTENLFIYNTFEFWVIFGMLIYLAGSFFIYIYANQLDPIFMRKYWFLTNIFYIVKNILFAIGIFTYIKKAAKKNKLVLNNKFSYTNN